MNLRCLTTFIVGFFLFAATTTVAQQDRWLHSMQHGDIAYFTAQSPAEIVRYDLASRQFLSSVPLSGAPTAFYVDDDGMYIAYNTIVARRELDGSNEVFLELFAGTVVSLVTFGDNLYANDLVDPFINRLDKNQGSVLETAFFFDSTGGFSIAPSELKIFGRTLSSAPPDITRIELAADGDIATQVDSPFSGTFPDASITYVFPQEDKVVDDSGTVYFTSDLNFAGDLGGAFAHIAFRPDEAIVLRQGTIGRYDSENLEHVTDLGAGNSLLYIYEHSDQVVGFYDNGVGSLATEVVPLTRSGAISPGLLVDPDGLAYEPDDIEVAIDGTLLLLSIDEESIFRWSPSLNQYTQSIPLTGEPEFFTYSQTDDVVYVGYDDGEVTRVNLASGVEFEFVETPRRVVGIEMAGPYLFVADPTGSRYTHFTFDSSGQELSSESGKRRSDQYAWSETNQKMYFFNDDNNGDRLMSEDIDEFGIISDDEDESPGTNSSDIDYPIRVAPDGSFVLLGSGRIFDALSLQIVDSLPNDLADAQWLSDRSIAAVGIVSGNLFVQEYDASYQLQSEIRLTSDFANVVADDDTLYLVWEKDGIPQFSPWNFGSADFDEDGTDNEEDAFPFDPTESADNDQDGTGDNADTDDDNDGVPDVDDAFPRDPDESVDTDRDGIGDNEDTDDDNDGVLDGNDAFPLDPTEAVDTDDDGIGNNADPDDDNDGVPDVDDPFPLDDDETSDNDNDGIGDNSDPDDDNDGVLDINDAFPLDRDEFADTDGDGIGNNADTDDDNDGVLDGDDAFPLNPDETLDTDGDGIGNNADPDDDNDLIPDIVDPFPLDPGENADSDGDGIGNNIDPDDDNDGVEDVFDAFPLNPNETTDTDSDGLGNNADPDDDNDGVLDFADLFPLDPTEFADFDGDGIGDNGDPDDDNDGVNDGDDAFPRNNQETLDTDRDGVGNNADIDDDNDGVPDTEDEVPLDPTETKDFDDDGIGDNADPDDDNDGVNDAEDLWPFDATRSRDNDSDGIDDNTDDDDDNDGMSDAYENQYGLNRFDPSDAAGDLDGDGLTNLQEFNNGTDPRAPPASQDLLDGSSGGGSMTTDVAVLLLLLLAFGWHRRRSETVPVLARCHVELVGKRVTHSIGGAESAALRNRRKVQ